ncbi:MAG: small nuclear ribonucleoprotein (Sm) [Thermoproteota archaeon]|nr:MAG: small nuclear ribonucleoprotein (Sm) [Candidatus Korarchaeota archaeon]
MKMAHGGEVVVRLKNGVEVAGKLLVYDDMMNLVLAGARERDPRSKKVIRQVGTLFIRGNNVLFITLEE